ncbi:IS30 family transposase [Nocardia wallacei]|uniref:IS30 family transposase n=1 Tax=Nocardia wallacei TaxID=480035 RepID=UPI003CC80DC5
MRELTSLRPIRNRPAHVKTRRQAGHWEGNLIVGTWKLSAIATLVEHTVRYTLLVRLPHGHSAPTVEDALITAFTRLPQKLRRTFTWYQGNEMVHYERIEAATGLRIYFADPHSPWRRGSNENTDGLLRQYLPKKAPISANGTTSTPNESQPNSAVRELWLQDKTSTDLLRQRNRHG